ncbi:MAG: hypothetical protein JO077_05075 [Verrucomicrobia bacterium]|nr:hypothetical protein [Verrucomicrobiota bacterium]
MYLIFPRAMTIPEVASRREDHHFEDWLTATLIENTNRALVDTNESCVPGITDLWMLEIAERNGKMWTGKFRVEFETAAQERLINHRQREMETGMFFFSLDTDTGEILFA